MSRWIVFLALFLCIYGSLHLYVLIKIRRAFYLEGLSYFLLLVILAFLMFAPLQARLLTTQGYPTFGLITNWIGYLWMGYLFLFVCLAAPIDLYHLIMAGLQQLFKVDWTDFMLLRRQSLMLAALAAGGLMIYGAYSAYQVGIERVTLRSEKIPARAGRIRIVQITDLHLGPMIYPGRLGPILAAVREAQPDILVSTGDFIDGAKRHVVDVAPMFKALPAPLGKFAVTGNHEYYHGINDSLAFTEHAGFQILRNTGTVVQDLIAIAGVDDPTAGIDTVAAEAAALAGLPPDKFTVLLKHRPTIDPSARPRFDLQLSGHTHKGQIFPFGLVVRLMYPLMDGLYEIGPSRFLYASRGTGTWGPPIRLLSAPEITVFDLLPADAAPESKPQEKMQ
ncbi:MAG: metallophosphoesterase [Desulfobacteraceae bacterium]|nr:MAG: metallophosphoesterase [Desulfobacteraceae bacterium]